MRTPGWRALHSDSAWLPEELAGVGFTAYAAINVPTAGLQAFVTANDEHIVVSFRGSEEVLDWLTNLSFAQAAAGSEGLPGAGLATSLIDDLDYAHIGRMFHYVDGAWTEYGPLDDTADTSFRGSLDAAGWLALLGLASQGAEHDRDTYLCLMRERAFGF